MTAMGPLERGGPALVGPIPFATGGKNPCRTPLSGGTALLAKGYMEGVRLSPSLLGGKTQHHNEAPSRQCTPLFLFVLHFLNP